MADEALHVIETYLKSQGEGGITVGHSATTGKLHGNAALKIAYLYGREIKSFRRDEQAHVAQSARNLVRILNSKVIQDQGIIDAITTLAVFLANQCPTIQVFPSGPEPEETAKPVSISSWVHGNVGRTLEATM